MYALLALIFTLPFAIFVGQCLFVTQVIDPGRGPHGDKPWTQPLWLSRYGLTDHAIWQFPSQMMMILAVLGLIVPITAIVKRSKNDDDVPYPPYAAVNLLMRSDLQLEN